MTVTSGRKLGSRIDVETRRGILAEPDGMSYAAIARKWRVSDVAVRAMRRAAGKVSWELRGARAPGAGASAHAQLHARTYRPKGLAEAHGNPAAAAETVGGFEVAVVPRAAIPPRRSDAASAGRDLLFARLAQLGDGEMLQVTVADRRAGKLLLEGLRLRAKRAARVLRTGLAADGVARCFWLETRGKE